MFSMGWDIGIFHAINGLAGHVDSIDDIVEWISRFGPFVMVAGLIALWLWPGTRLVRDERQWTVIAATLTVCLALGVNQIIIRLWERPRPFLSHQAHLLMAAKYDPSFPSDHATFAFAVAVSIALVFRRIGVVALLMAVLIGLARIYVGEHYFSDVVVGSLIGTAAAFAVSALRARVMLLIDPALRHVRRFHLA
jgi:undecaprenyl-diphosphatase